MFDHLYKYVFFLCHHTETTKDIVQDTFLKVLQSSSSYREQKNPKAWLFAIAHNQLVSLFRKQSRELLTDIMPETDVVNSIESDCINSITLIEALKNLSISDREIVLLHVIAGLRFREISTAMNMPLGTVTGAYRRAISKLKSLLLN